MNIAKIFGLNKDRPADLALICLSEAKYSVILSFKRKKSTTFRDEFSHFYCNRWSSTSDGIISLVWYVSSGHRLWSTWKVILNTMWICWCTKTKSWFDRITMPTIAKSLSNHFWRISIDTFQPTPTHSCFNWYKMNIANSFQNWISK